jgi:hypothetical protein
MNIDVATPEGAAGEGWLQVDLHGTFAVNYGDYDARAQLLVDGETVGAPVTWLGPQAQQIRVPLTDVFLDGTHQVTIQPMPVEGRLGAFLVDKLRVEYPRYYVADSVTDTLTATANGHSVLTVRGLSGSDVRVYDITAPHAPQVVSGVAVDDLGDQWTATFAASSADSRYLVLGPNAMEALPDLVADSASDLANAANAADYLVIAPRDLEAGALELADYRASAAGGGYVVQTAWLDDIQDEFAYGLDTPYAIRDFLAHVHQNWQTPPAFVVLLGVGHFDHKNANPVDPEFDTNLIPVLMAPTPWGLAASDNRYFDVAGDDGVPEFLGGRLPVLSDAEVSDYLVKLAAYEGSAQPAEDPAWTSRVTLLADNPDAAGEFVADSDALADLVSGEYIIDRLYTGVTDRLDVTPASNSVAVAAFEAGSLLYNYVGHGDTVSLAANPVLFTRTNALSLGNANPLAEGARLPVFAALTCGAGNFASPTTDSLGEALVLNPGGGAIVSFVPTGLSRNDQAHIMNRAFVDALVGAEPASLVSEAVDAAYVAHQLEGTENAAFMRYIYSLLGDPAVMVR